MRWAVAAVPLLLAGCLTAEPVAPEGQAGTWSGVWDGPFAAMSFGYGFVAVDEDGYGPAVPAIAVDHAGHVLAFQVRYRSGAGPHQVELDAASGPWRGPVEEVLAPGVVWPQDAQNQYRVTRAEGSTLAEKDWHAVRHAIRDGIATAREPKAHEDRFVADGGSRLLFAEGRRVTLDDNHDDGAGWGDIEEQLRLLSAWMADEGS